MSEESSPVKVYVYDLSHGLAAVYSPMILGRAIDGIFHTSVVFNNKEYYIDQGIKVCNVPGTTKYGAPKEVLSVGDTFVLQDILDEFMDELRTHEDQKYHALKYDLFDNNCNHFTDVVIDFLVGKNLDDRILKLPEQVLATPNGQMLKQMLGGGAGGAMGNARFGF